MGDYENNNTYQWNHTGEQNTDHYEWHHTGDPEDPTQRTGYSRRDDHTSSQEGKKNKGKGRKVAKTAFAVSLAAIFGISAGLGVYGAQNFNKVSGSLFQTETSSVEESASVSEASTSAEKLTVNSKTDSDLKVTTTSTSDTAVITSDVTSVVQSVMPSIVAINVKVTQQEMNMFGQISEREGQGSGSGIIVAQSDKELIIVTNNHVVADANSMEVVFIDGSTATAYLKGTDSSVDIAVIAVELDDLTQDTITSISVATLGDSNTLTVGEPAIVIGNALGYGQSVTTGVVSAVGREIETEDGSKNTFIQTDAAINPGNSGGAMLNAKGEVIGVTSSKIGATTVEGIGFAIPISDVIDLINNLMNENTKITVADEQKGALGVQVMTPTGIAGAYVAGVTEGSAADKAGIKEGDLITSFAGNQISSASDLTSMMSYYAEGDTVKVVVLRRVGYEYQTVELEATLDNASTLNN